MEKLAEELGDALADTFAFYFKAHAFHWNVVGPLFPQLHALFGDIYEDAHDAVDAIAEHIRTLNEYAPMNLTDLLKDTKIKEAKGEMTDAGMIKTLKADNDKVMDSLGTACAAAGKAGEVGIANFLQDRIDKHAKWSWQLKATSGG